MIEPSTINNFYPNKMGHVLMEALEEVIGPKGMNEVLALAHLSHRINNYPPNNLELQFPSYELSLMQTALEHLYGQISGLGVALRFGRVCFKYSMREINNEEMSFRLLPLERKLKVGAGLFASLFSQYTRQNICLSEEMDRFIWEIQSCPICINRHSESPICHLAVGIVQESMFWISGGKFFRVEETQCIAKGDPKCTIVAYKKALE